MTHRIMILGDYGDWHAVAIALQRATGADVVVSYATPARAETIDHYAEHVRTQAASVDDLVRMTTPVSLATPNRAERRGNKSEAYYARRDQIARKGGKR